MARLALGSPALVEIANSANSPNAAYGKAYLETGDVKLSISCQNLAKIKRDYGKAKFDEIVSAVVSSINPPTSNLETGQRAKEKR
jgi:hypothetical protein